MNVLDKINQFTPLDIMLFVIFIVYIVFPVETPAFLASSVNSPLGMLTLFVVTLFLFLYTNPILAVLYIFVAYELIRRSQHTIQGSMSQPSIRHSSDLQKHNPMQKPVTQYKQENIVLSQNNTLEEEVVGQMAPVGHSDPAMYISTSYKPISEPVGSASLF